MEATLLSVWMGKTSYTVGEIPSWLKALKLSGKERNLAYLRLPNPAQFPPSLFAPLSLASKELGVGAKGLRDTAAPLPDSWISLELLANFNPTAWALRRALQASSTSLGTHLWHSSCYTTIFHLYCSSSLSPQTEGLESQQVWGIPCFFFPSQIQTCLPPDPIRVPLLDMRRFTSSWCQFSICSVDMELGSHGFLYESTKVGLEAVVTKLFLDSPLACPRGRSCEEVH